MAVLHKEAAFLILLVLVSIQFHVYSSKGAEARPLPSVSQQSSTSVKVLESLGLRCRCCDGAGGECRSTGWDATSCSSTKLHCNPWKY